MQRIKRMEEKYKYIFSLRLAGYLMMNGFRILRINHNLKVSDKDVYFFGNSPELCAMMEKYSKDKNSKEKKYVINKNCKDEARWKDN